eukprot:1676126-Lingulodinium_polyedra.AAC.1
MCIRDRSSTDMAEPAATARPSSVTFAVPGVAPTTFAAPVVAPMTYAASAATSMTLAAPAMVVAP